MKPGPFAVFHLAGQELREWGIMNFGQRAQDHVATHDPEHVEATQRIEGKEPRRGNVDPRDRWLNRGYHITVAADVRRL